jgi:hypothetical protein
VALAVEPRRVVVVGGQREPRQLAGGQVVMVMMM